MFLEEFPVQPLCGQLCRQTAHEQDGGRFSKWPPFHKILFELTPKRL